MSGQINVILIDDHVLVLEGLRCLLSYTEDIHVVEIFQNGENLYQFLEKQPVDVVILDLQMPYHGLRVLQDLRQHKIPIPVLVLTSFGDRETMKAVIELEAAGFILKTEPSAQLIEAIRQVAQGRLIFPKAAQQWLLDKEAESGTLSARELEVLSCVARGLTNSEIARELHVSKNTIGFHLKNIFGKLQVSNRTEATVWYFTYQSSFS